MNRNQDRLALSILLCLLLGAGVGLVNGLLVSLRNVPPFAATLGMLACIEGAILVYTKGVPAGQIPSSLRPVALVGIGIVPYSLLICLAVAAAAHFRAPARHVRAEDLRGRTVARGRAARGDLDDERPRLGVCHVQRPGGDRRDHPQRVRRLRRSEDRRNYNLESIAAAVLGGVAFTGGQGGALGALAGAVFLLALLNVVTLSSLNPFTQLIVQGVVMLVAVSAFQLLNKRTAT